MTLSKEYMKKINPELFARIEKCNKKKNVFLFILGALVFIMIISEFYFKW